MRDANVVSNMYRNEGFNTISRVAPVDAETSNGFDTGEASIDDVLDGTPNGGEVDKDVQAPTTSARLEELDMATENRMVSRSKKGINDLTRELGKQSFKDKEELIRDIKLYTIEKRKQYEVVETCPTIWKIRCRFWSESNCKWLVRACKRKRTGDFQITQYIGPHTCLDNEISQDHPNLDANLIAQEIEHIVKEKPNISVPALRAEMIDKLGYTASYMKVWSAKKKAIKHIFGQSEESASPNSEGTRRGKGRPRSAKLVNGMDVDEEKIANLCGICRQRGHNRKTCPSKPNGEPADP